MVYLIMKLAYLTYFLGLAYFFGKSVSYAMFSGDSFYGRAGFIFKSALMSVVWPMTLLSRAGRDYLIRFNKLN